MKFDGKEELMQFYITCDKVTDIEKDDDGDIVAFCFEKKYPNRRHKKVRASLKKGKSTVYKAVDDEREFFQILDKNLEQVHSVKMRNGKIWKFKIGKKGYKIQKPEGIGLFDIFPYRYFNRICAERFYLEDEILRNGYFTGLIGSSAQNIELYLLDKSNYDLFDIDINHAYSEVYDYNLPFGKFYTAPEWAELSERERSVCIKFYHIRLKTIKNSANVFISLPPFQRYRDFDFLMSKRVFDMIVSEYRLALIDKIYGSDVYDMVECYYCRARKYPKIQEFYRKMNEKIDEKKKAGESTAALKTATNSLTGMFARKDEQKSIAALKKIDSAVAGEVFVAKYTAPIRCEHANYLPIAMCVNDICALKLFWLLEESGRFLPISWNTDGAVVAVRPWETVDSSSEWGNIKAKPIFNPRVLNCALVANRPIIYDEQEDEVFNSNSISWNADTDCFVWEKTERLNTPNGFIELVTAVPIPVEEYTPRDYRRAEILARLHVREFMRACNDKSTRDRMFFELRALLSPYDLDLNIPRPLVEYDLKRYQEFFKILS